MLPCQPPYSKNRCRKNDLICVINGYDELYLISSWLKQNEKNINSQILIFSEFYLFYYSILILTKYQQLPWCF